MRKVLFFIVALLTAATAWAETQTVSYIDADGIEQTVTATVLTGNETVSAYGSIDLAAGWYVVNSNISYTTPIGYTSPLGTINIINIILADDAEMTVNVSGLNAILLSSYFQLAI